MDGVNLLTARLHAIAVKMRLSIFCAKVAPPSLSYAENRHFGAAEVKFGISHGQFCALCFIRSPYVDNEETQVSGLAAFGP